DVSEKLRHKCSIVQSTGAYLRFYSFVVATEMSSTKYDIATIIDHEISVKGDINRAPLPIIRISPFLICSTRTLQELAQCILISRCRHGLNLSYSCYESKPSRHNWMKLGGYLPKSKMI